MRPAPARDRGPHSCRSRDTRKPHTAKAKAAHGQGGGRARGAAAIGHRKSRQDRSRRQARTRKGPRASLMPVTRDRREQKERARGRGPGLFRVCAYLCGCPAATGPVYGRLDGVTFPRYPVRKQARFPGAPEVAYGGIGQA
ncbi:hypothetical protein GCM10010129_47160 [Streptomyces fumigatiscleroticus]|nr:hypothetical protein GCM10010129_47160 [Streptomyces fumigatiscleroticus]